MSDLLQFKTYKTKRYTTVDLTNIEDPRLSWKAKGLHLYLMSRPGEWKIWMNDLLKRATDRHTSIRNGLTELNLFGYIHKIVKRDSNGHIESWKYLVFEFPTSIEQVEKELDKGFSIFMSKKNRALFDGNLLIGNQLIENQTYSNNNLNNNNISNSIINNTIRDSSESQKSLKNNSSKLENDSKKQKTSKKKKEIKDKSKNEIVEYWNSKKEQYPKITFHKSPNTKIYQNAVKYINALKQGRIKRYCSLIDQKVDVPKKLLTKKWTDEELKNAIDKLCLLFVDGYWPENKDKIPKNLVDLIFNSRTETSWFYNILKTPPKKLWEESEVVDEKSLESYTKFYGDYIDSVKKKSKLNKLVNDLVRKQKKIYSEIGGGLLSTGFRSKFGYEEDPERFVIQHLEYLKRYPNKTLQLLRTDNGVWKGFVKWFGDFHGYDIRCEKKKVEKGVKKRKRIKNDGIIPSADPLLDAI